MKRKKKPPKGYSVKTALIFFILVILLFLMSISFRIATLAKESKFDGKNRFTLMVTEKSYPQKGGLVKILSFDPQTESILLVTVAAHKKPLEMGSFLAVPIDAQILCSGCTAIHDVKGILKNILFSFVGKRNVALEVTPIDIGRLFLFTNSVSPSSIKTISLSSNQSEAEIDRKTSSLFVDATMFKERISIEIVNATNISGFAARLARLITNMGGNIIVISTDKQLLPVSEISYYEKKSYTLLRLSKLLGFPISQRKKSEIADIIIMLGKDSNSSSAF